MKKAFFYASYLCISCHVAHIHAPCGCMFEGAGRGPACEAHCKKARACVPTSKGGCSALAIAAWLMAVARLCMDAMPDVVKWVCCKVHSVKGVHVWP